MREVGVHFGNDVIVVVQRVLKTEPVGVAEAVLLGSFNDVNFEIRGVETARDVSGSVSAGIVHHKHVNAGHRVPQCGQHRADVHRLLVRGNDDKC